MTRRRFYASPESFAADQSVVHLAAEETRHLRNVLRLVPGDRAFVFNGQGQEFECLIEEVKRDQARLKVLAEVASSSPESPLAMTLAVALLKGEKFDLVVQKSTELGVRTIIPTVTRLADVRLRDESDAQKRLVRWRRIALEAAKQSGRSRLPGISEPVDVSTLLRIKRSNQEMCLMFSERSGKSLNEVLEVANGIIAVTALVGSEGGWTDEEIEQIREANWKIVTLGGRTLRAETAAISVCALLQHRLGDFK